MSSALLKTVLILAAPLAAAGADARPLAVLGAGPAMPPEWLVRLLFASLAMLSGTACWQRRRWRERKQKQEIAAMLAEHARSLAQSKERAEEESRLKTRFLSDISNETRAPMNGVLNGLELALMTDLAPEQRTYLEGVRNSAQEILSLLGGTLDVSAQAPAPRREAARLEFSLRQCVRGVVATMSGRAREHKLSLHAEIPFDLPDRLVGDADRLREVLMRAIDNSINASVPGRIVVSVSRDRRGTSRPAANERSLALLFSIHDSGVPPAKGGSQALPPKEQGDGGAYERLPACVRLVKLMGGRMWIYREETGASRVCFTAPLEWVRATASPEPKDSEETAPVGPRLLLADSDRRSQVATLRLLEQKNFHCLVANDAKSALELLEQFPVDLVLVDAQVSHANAVEVTTLIRERERREDKARVPVLALTEETLRAGRDEFLALGVDALVPKPLELAQLCQAIEEFLPDGKTQAPVH